MVTAWSDTFPTTTVGCILHHHGHETPKNRCVTKNVSLSVSVRQRWPQTSRGYTKIDPSRSVRHSRSEYVTMRLSGQEPLGVHEIETSRFLVNEPRTARLSRLINHELRDSAVRRRNSLRSAFRRSPGECIELRDRASALLLRRHITSCSSLPE